MTDAAGSKLVVIGTFACQTRQGADRILLVMLSFARGDKLIYCNVT